MRQEWLEIGGFVTSILGVTDIKEGPPPGPEIMLVPFTCLSTERGRRTPAGRPRRSTCPGRENRLPEWEPLAEQLYHRRHRKGAGKRSRNAAARVTGRESERVTAKAGTIHWRNFWRSTSINSYLRLAQAARCLPQDSCLQCLTITRLGSPPTDPPTLILVFLDIPPIISLSLLPIHQRRRRSFMI